MLGTRTIALYIFKKSNGGPDVVAEWIERYTSGYAIPFFVSSSPTKVKSFKNVRVKPYYCIRNQAQAELTRLKSSNRINPKDDLVIRLVYT